MWFKKLFGISLLMGVSLFTVQTHAGSLDDISFSSLPGDKVQLKLQLSESLQQEPLSFTIDNPARIALDLPGTTLNLSQRTQPIGIGVAHSVTAVEAAGRTRVVVNLDASVPYEIESAGNTITLVLGAASVIAGTEEDSVTAKFGSGVTDLSGASLENIDFRRGTSGEGKVIITMSDPSIGVNIGEEGGKILVDFIGATLPESLNRRLDVVDFATPVSEVDTSPYGKGARMKISMSTDEYDHLAYQSENILTVEVKPLTKAEKEAIQKEKFGYTGERLSLNFQDIEVRAVLQLIADFTGLNMVASDTVGGNVTLRLKNVPWDQALDIILKSKGLGMRQEGNVIMVAPTQEIAAREKLELEASQAVEELAPLRTEFIQVNYADAAELQTLIKSGGGGENSILSERGNVTIDARTNTLIVQDTATSLESIRQLVNRLDIPVRQVLIESRIVNATETFAKDLGVQFGYSKRTEFTEDGDVELGALLGGTLENGVVTPTPQTGFDVGGTEGLLVDLPVVANGNIGLLVGKFGSYLLQLELSAAEAEGRTEDIATPKVITANQREAVIEQGVEIPYQERTSSGATSVSFKKAVLSLKVTPQITPDDRIILDLTVDQDTRGAPEVLGVPPINTRSVTTQVLVDNGETVVLGGVYTQTDQNNIDKVPFFGDLPYVGFLFKRTTVSDDKTELLIFVTPRILKENLTL